MFDIFDLVDYKTQVDNSRCLHSKSSKSQCRICIRSCKEKAIELRDGKILIKDNCNSCNSCVNSCPVGALTGEKMKFSYNEDGLIIDRNDFPKKFFASIKLDYFSKWYLNGVRKIIHNVEEQNFADRFNEFNLILSVNSIEKIENIYLEEIKEYRKKDISINRKDLLINFAGSILNGAKFMIGEKENTFRYFEIFQKNLKNHKSFFAVKIDNSCKKCKACTFLCPFKCLEINEKVEQKDFCNNCGLCEDICPYKSIKIVKDDITFEEASKVI